MAQLSVLLEQEGRLLSLSRDGVKAAERRLKSVRSQIQKKSEQLGITDSSLFITKPGYNSRMILSLATQAKMGSAVCILELQKLANWLIDINGQKTTSEPKVPYSNTGTLSDTPEKWGQL